MSNKKVGRPKKQTVTTDKVTEHVKEEKIIKKLEPTLDHLAYDLIKEDGRYVLVEVAYDITTGEGKIVNKKILSKIAAMAASMIKDLFTKKMLKLSKYR